MWCVCALQQEASTAYVNSLRQVTAASKAAVQASVRDYQQQCAASDAALAAALDRQRDEVRHAVASKSHAYDTAAAGCSTQRGLQVMRLSAQQDHLVRLRDSVTAYEGVVASLATTRSELSVMDRALLALVRHAVRARVVLTDGVVHEVHRQLQAVADEWISDGREDDAVPNVAAARHWRRDLAPQLHALAAAVPLTGTPQRL